MSDKEKPSYEELEEELNSLRKSYNILKEEERKYRFIFETSKDAIGLSKNGIIVFFNDAYLHLFGYEKKEELMGLPVLSLIAPKEKNRIKSYIESKNENGEVPFFYESTGIKKNGEEFPFEVNIGQYCIDKEIYKVVIVRDITQRKEAERELIDSNEKFAAAFNKSSIMQAITSASDGIIYDVNDAYIEQTGYQLKDIKNKSTLELNIWVSESDREDFVEAINSNKSVRNKEYKLYNKFGIIKDCILSASKVKIGGKDYILTNILDITDRKLTEKKLIESEERWHFSVDGSGRGLWDWNLETDEVYLSPQWKKMLGYKESEIKNDLEEWRSRVHPDDMDNVMADLDVHFKGETQLYINEHRLRCKNGEYKWIRDRGKVLSWNKQGDPVRIIGTHTDIDAQKRDQQNFVESIAKFKLLFEQSPLGIYIADREGNILDSNKRLLELLDSPSLEATKQINVLEFPALVKNGYADVFKKCISTGEKQHLEMLYTSYWGRQSHLSSYIVPLYDSQNNIQHVYTLMEDITERQKIEKELKESQQLLELFFKQSAIGFVFMMLDEPIEWNENTDKEKVLDYILDHHRITKINDAMLNQYGAKQEDFIGHTPKIHFNYNIEQGKKLWRKLLDNGRVHVEGEDKRLDGTSMIINGDFICIYDEEGRLKGHFGAQVDVTEERNTQKALKQSEELLKVAQKIAHLGSWSYNYRTKKTEWSDEIYSIFEVSKQEIQPDSNYLFEHIYKDDLKDFLKKFKHAKNSKKTFDIMHRILVNKTKVKYVRGRGNFEFDSNGKVIAMNGTIQDVTKERLLQMDLIKSELLKKNILANQPILIWAKDTKGVFIAANPEFQRFLGVKEEEILGKTDYDFANKELSDFYREYDNIALSTGVPTTNEEWVVYQESGKRVLLETTKTPLRDENGEIFGVLGVAYDITKRTEREEALREAKIEADKANRFKSEFLANMSHEIRTPMNAVLGYADILSKNLKDNPENLSYVEGISKSGQNLITLINDILDLSKIEAGRLDIVPEVIDFKKEIEDVEQIFAASISKRKIDFSVHTDADLPRMLMLDRTRIKQVLFNLIGNAIKFTEQGSVEVNVKKEGALTPDEKFNLYFEVKDSGIGISEEKISAVFDAFRQTHGQSSKYEGTGLGLTISKRLVEAMGGTISVVSKKGEGATFKVHLKNVQIPSRVNLQKFYKGEKNIPEIEFNSPQVLIVDDVESNIIILRKKLVELGCVVVSAINGKDALEKVEHNKPDLIIMDIQMPVLNGYDATKILRKEKRFNKIPVIALTALALNEQREEFSKVFDDYLIKPLEYRSFIQSLMKFLPYKEKTFRSHTSSNNVGETLKLPTNLPASFVEGLKLKVFPLFEELKTYFDTEECFTFLKELSGLVSDYNILEFDKFQIELSEATKKLRLKKIHELLDQFDLFRKTILYKND